MALYSTLAASGGIMRTRALLDAGHTRHELTALVESGRLTRPLRGWIALPRADPQLVYAARHGVILSCMTVIRRAGLWARHSQGDMHFASRSPHSHLSAEGRVIHWARPLSVRPPHTLVDSLENALAYVVTCQPAEEAHAIWESALNRGRVTRESMRRLPLSRAARALLDECTPFSDSGLESIVGRRTRALGLTVYAQIWLLGHRVDFLIENWLVLQIDGSTHTGPQRDADNRHDALLAANGYSVIRVSYRQVMFEWPWVQHQIMLAVSQGRR